MATYTKGYRIIGILGGMGPQASCELYRLINDISVRTYGAKRNSDFPHLLINSLPVPDLIADAQGQEGTVGLVRDGARNLCRAGATDLMMACNTMHAFAEDITKPINCRFHSIVDIVIDALKRKEINNIYVLSTRTTMKSFLYQTALEKAGIRYHLPSEEMQESTVQNILNCIAGSFSSAEEEKYMLKVINEAKKEAKTEAVLLACTELPLILKRDFPRDIRKISSLEEMARKICSIHFTP